MPLNPEELARRWNATYPVGTPTTTRSEATVMPGNHAVIWVESEAGCWALERVSPR